LTFGGWIVFGILAFFIAGCSLYVFCECSGKTGRIVSVLVGVILIAALLFGLRWYFSNTASGQRAMIDQKSNLDGGIERTVTVYTANGDVIAQYQGKIDIAANDGGYIKFDFDGKRYIYYNCFVETIADIEAE